MNYNNPLISCVCITTGCPLVLQRALACFLRQDYPNTELIISYPNDDQLTKTVIDQIENTFIINMTRIAHLRGEKTLFTKNDAINAANGDFICLWNDEHWHHMNRISDQYRVLKNSPFMSSVLMHILLFDFKNEQTYHSAYRAWEETLLCEKNLLIQATYIDIERTDDSSVIHFLSSKNVLYHLSECPHLYINIFHQNDHNKVNLDKQFLLESEVLIDLNATVQELINMDYYLPRNL